MSRLEDIEAKRAELYAQKAAAADEQLATDLEAIYPHELAGRVGLKRLSHTPGSPVRVAVRPAKPAEVKRFHARAKVDKNGKVDPNAANEAVIELGAICQLYPELGSELDKAWRESHPQAVVDLGLLALKLAGAQEAEEGKDS